MFTFLSSFCSSRGPLDTWNLIDHSSILACYFHWLFWYLPPYSHIPNPSHLARRRTLSYVCILCIFFHIYAAAAANGEGDGTPLMYILSYF